MRELAGAIGVRVLPVPCFYHTPDREAVSKRDFGHRNWGGWDDGPTKRYEFSGRVSPTAPSIAWFGCLC